MHNRLAPKKHSFHYNVFMFYVDLDEIDILAKKYFLFSHNCFNVFSFRDGEHLQIPADAPDKIKTTKQHIIDYVQQNGVSEPVSKITLLTNMNVLGYHFNPVSFYFCFDEKENPLCCIVEISNTFREMKPFFIGKENFKANTFHLNTTKYFYVSPFIDHDTNFDFNIALPDEKLNIRIDDYKDNNRFFISTLTGSRKPLSNRALLWYSIRFPFIPLQIMGLIHWQAFKLWLKKIPFHRKNMHMDLQRDVHRKYKSTIPSKQ